MEDNQKDYENHVRSNESVRDNMDGRLDEPRMSQSSESCDSDNSKCDNSQSVD